MTDVVDRVLGDATLVGFFAATDRDRLETCVARHICDLDGPCRYGEEIDLDTPCRDMVTAHTGLTEDGTGDAIAHDDFARFMDHVVDAVAGTSLSEADRSAIVDAFSATCSDVVPGGAGCP